MIRSVIDLVWDLARAVGKAVRAGSHNLTAAAAAVVEIEASISAVNQAARTITGTLIPPGSVIGNTSAGPTRFAAGSLTWSDPRRVKLLMEHDRERPLGFATALDWTPAGLVGTFHLPSANDPEQEALRVRVLADAASGVRDGLSVGANFAAGGVVRGSDGVLEVRAGLLRETSMVSVPAFDDSRVTSVAATANGGNMEPCNACGHRHAIGTPCITTAASPAGPVVEATAPSAQSIVDELMDRLRSGDLVAAGAAGPTIEGVPAAAGAPAGQAQGVNLATFTELVAAAHSGNAGPDEVRDLQAALTDITPTNQPQAFRPEYLSELWDSVPVVRKTINNAFTSRPLTSMKVIGQRWTTRPTVDDYAGDKADVPSNLPILEDIPVNAARLAGAHDVDRIFMDLGSPEWLASYFEAQTEDYQEKSNARAATALWDGATVIADGNGVAAGEADTVVGAAVAAVVELAGIGQGVEYVAMAPGLIAELLGITTLDAPAFFSGQFQLGNGGDGNLGGTNWFTAPGLPAGGVVVGVKSAARWHEMSPPIRVQAQNVAQGGIDLGVFGYYAAYVRDPRKVRKATVAPAA